jgi:hypothetical protein
MRRETELSVYSLVFAIQHENLSDPHSILVGEERFISRRIRHQAEKVVWDELTRADVARGGRLDGEFRDVLAVIQRAGTEYYGWVTGEEGSFALLVAASGRDAVAMVRTGETVSIELIRADYLAEEVIGRLPEVPAGRGKPISVLASDFAAGNNNAPTYLSGGASTRHPEARRLDALLRAPRTGGGKLYSARRDHSGTRRRSEDWVTYIDLEHGRWITYRTNGAEPFITAAPGTPQLLAGRLAELN